jgi:predicted transposase/invertase (TIGR01784 family)
LKERPAELQGPIFDLLFEVATINNLTTVEMEVYTKSLAEYDDVRLIMECSRDEGMKKGIEKGRKEGIEKGREKGRIEGITYIAQNMLKLQIPIKDIAKATGLTLEQIRQLQNTSVRSA